MLVQGVIKYNSETKDKTKLLNIASFGMSTGYRSYKDQIYMYADWKYGDGNLAATPTNTTNIYTYRKQILARMVENKEYEKGGELYGNGTSQHGWGIAIDFNPHDQQYYTSGKKKRSADIRNWCSYYK